MSYWGEGIYPFICERDYCVYYVILTLEKFGSFTSSSMNRFHISHFNKWDTLVLQILLKFRKKLIFSLLVEYFHSWGSAECLFKSTLHSTQCRNFGQEEKGWVCSMKQSDIITHTGISNLTGTQVPGTLLMLLCQNSLAWFTGSSFTHQVNCCFTIWWKTHIF